MFVLVEPMSTRRYEPTMQASIKEALRHGIPWTLQVLSHWLYSSSSSLPLATMRRKMVETLVPIWHVGEHRDEIAPILAVAVAMPGYNRQCPERIPDWEAVFALLPEISATQTSLSEAECVIAGGVMQGAMSLDGPWESKARGYVIRVKARLGPKVSRVEEGIEKRHQWGSCVQHRMLDCEVAKNYRSTQRKFEEVRQERARMFWKNIPQYPYIPFSATN